MPDGSAPDNQFSAPNGRAIDNQLRSRDWTVRIGCSRIVDILPREGVRVLAILVVSLLDEILQERAIFCSDISFLCQQDRSVTHKYASGRHQKELAPRFP